MTSTVDIKPLSFIDLARQQQRIKPQIDQAIARVLAHGKYIMGPEVGALEAQLCEYTGAKHAIACASGTDALLMGLMAYGVGPGDAVMVPSMTFPATPEVVTLLGATPIFVDVDRLTFNIDANSVEQGVALAKRQGLTPKGILAVDLYGLPADYDVLSQVAQSHDLWLMGDAAQSFGGSVRGHQVGTLTEITTLSFFPAKPLGCYGDGGAVLTSNDAYADIMRSIRVHGKGQSKYDIVRTGLNSRLDTMQAAILLQKLSIFADECAARQRHAAYYSQLLTEVNVLSPVIPDGYASAWAQYTLILPEGVSRKQVQSAMLAEGVPTMVYYPRPLHEQPANTDYPKVSSLACSEMLSQRVLSLPMHPYLTEENQQQVVSALKKAL